MMYRINNLNPFKNNINKLNYNMHSSSHHIKLKQLQNSIQLHHTIFFKYYQCRLHFKELQTSSQNIQTFMRFFNNNIVKYICNVVPYYITDQMNKTRHVALPGKFHYTKNEHFEHWIAHLDMKPYLNNVHSNKFNKHRRLYIIHKSNQQKALQYLTSPKNNCSKWLHHSFQTAAKQHAMHIYDTIYQLNTHIQVNKKLCLANTINNTSLSWH